MILIFLSNDFFQLGFYFFGPVSEQDQFIRLNRFSYELPDPVDNLEPDEVYSLATLDKVFLFIEYRILLYCPDIGLYVKSSHFKYYAPLFLPDLSLFKVSLTAIFGKRSLFN